MLFCKSKMSRFLKDRLRTAWQPTCGGCACCLPHSVLQGSPLWWGAMTCLVLMRGKNNVMVETLKALELLERKGFSVYLWNIGRRSCGALKCNYDLPVDDVTAVHSGPSSLWVWEMTQSVQCRSLPMVMFCYFLSCSTFRPCCKGKLYVESIVIASRTQSCDIPFPFGPFKKVICGSFRHVFNV